jgi:hypothetical protein
MKLDQLRKIIREEVKAAVKEELQEMLTEAVRVASQPDAKPNVQKFESQTKIQEVQTAKSSDPIAEMINQTKASMNNDEYRNVISGTSDMVQKPNFAEMMASNMGMVDSGRPAPGLDISQFDFVKKAGAVYKASVEKDKQKYGVA